LTKENEELERIIAQNEELERIIAQDNSQQGTATASPTGPRTRSHGKPMTGKVPEYKQGQGYDGKQQLFQVVRDDNDRCSVNSRTN